MKKISSEGHETIAFVGSTVLLSVGTNLTLRYITGDQTGTMPTVLAVMLSSGVVLGIVTIKMAVRRAIVMAAETLLLPTKK